MLRKLHSNNCPDKNRGTIGISGFDLAQNSKTALKTVAKSITMA